MSMQAFYLAAAAASEEDLPGPTGAPSSPSVYFYAGGTSFGLQWTVGDPNADTLIHKFTVPNIVAQVGPGVTNIDLGPWQAAPGMIWSVQHSRNGQESAANGEVIDLDTV